MPKSYIFEPPVNDIVESETEIELKDQVLTTTLANREDDQTSLEKKQITLVKRKERCENADIIPERFAKVARTTQWRKILCPQGPAVSYTVEPQAIDLIQTGEAIVPTFYDTVSRIDLDNR
ncbi:hypothetical protein BDQ17DRAFT_1547351, partial [Cyathus striatus]